MFKRKLKGIRAELGTNHEILPTLTVHYLEIQKRFCDPRTGYDSEIKRFPAF